MCVCVFVCVCVSGTGGLKGKEVALRLRDGGDAPGSLHAEEEASERDPI